MAVHLISAAKKEFTQLYSNFEYYLLFYILWNSHKGCFYSRIPLPELPLRRHYVRDEDKRINSQSTPSVCDRKNFMYHIIKPEQNAKGEEHSSGKRVSALFKTFFS